MLSKYVRVRERGSVVAIFHELHPVPFYCAKEDWQAFVAGIGVRADMQQELIERRLIVSCLEEDEREFQRVAKAVERKLSQPNILYLMTAQGCNFRCGYCPVPELAKKLGETLLSGEDARSGIELWARHISDRFDETGRYVVIFYGGEPLLNIPVIVVSLSHIRTLKEKGVLPQGVSSMIATNGACVDENVVAMCKEHDVTVVVGIDGMREANDSLKVDILGNGTFDRIVSAIKQLVSGGVHTCTSVMIHPFNINQIEKITGFLEGLGVEKIGFNFLRGKHLHQLVDPTKTDAYFRQAAQVLIRNANTGTPGFEYQMEKKVSAFRQGDFFPVDCTCYGNQLVIQPDGQISHCPFSKPKLGNVREVGRGFRISEQLIVSEWRKRLPLYHSAYAASDAKALCGTGCAWGSEELYNDALALDAGSKIFSEEVFNELIWSNYTQEKA
ncbi:MAG: radical SAM protein [bacterium]|nr:radical SAM protein [bacterium]